MSSWNTVATRLIACALAAGLFVIAPATNGASAKEAAAHRANARSYVLENRRHRRGVRIALPRGPSQIYNDYPYYYARGYYPRHIGGYTYYPALGRCRGWHRGCGSALPRGQREACRCP
jgi:hypothetical protein